MRSSSARVSACVRIARASAARAPRTRARGRSSISLAVRATLRSSATRLSLSPLGLGEDLERDEELRPVAALLVDVLEDARRPRRGGPAF